MSEASGRQEMERRLIEKSLQDEAFRQRLMEDPKGAVEQELGTRFARGGTGGDRGGNCRHHLPGASKHPDGRR